MLLTDRPALLLTAMIVEAALGYPARLPHPVCGIGRVIAVLDAYWNRGTHKRALGVITALILIALGGSAGLLIEHFARGWSWVGVLAIVLVATIGLAQRSLHDHVAAVAKPLVAGDLEAARTALAMIVGRDTAALDDSGIAAAATETLAESFCDGIVAPAFWFLILGLPGLFAFKAISTADSMIGHMDDRHRDFGWAAARIDDVMNWIPARIAGVLICLASLGGWRIMLRDGRNHLSPNAGWPESAMAGALRVQLGGGAAYDGEWIARATLGEGHRPLPADLPRAISLYHRACLLLWAMAALLAGGLLWLR
jgi:adenosylcobinamide-phosphate synthase